MAGIAADTAAAELGIFLPHFRSIGGIIANVTIEEHHDDDLQITQHPVEQGAPIADHAFKQPSHVTIRAGWSTALARDLSAESGVYGLLLSWQASLLPFDVLTGKRMYTNMLMERLSVTTDRTSEYALMATITCRQIIIVGTQVADVTGMSDSTGNQDSPDTTGAEQDTGDQQPDNKGSTGDGGTGSSDLSQTTPSGIPTTGEDSRLTPAQGVPNTSAIDNPTSEAASVNSQMNANGAQPPNSPAVTASPNDFY